MSTIPCICLVLSVYLGRVWCCLLAFLPAVFGGQAHNTTLVTDTKDCVQPTLQQDSPSLEM